MVTQTVVKNILAKYPYTFEKIDVADLKVDERYQRKPSPWRSKEIGNAWNDMAAVVLLVSRRDNGENYIMDGQRRWGGAKIAGVEFVNCMVFTGVPYEIEAHVHTIIQTHRDVPQALDTFRAELEAKHPEAIAIDNIVKSCGLEIAKDKQYIGGGSSTKTRPYGVIWAVIALKDVYLSGGASGLEETLLLIKQVWPGDSDAFKDRVITGVYKFNAAYKGRYEKSELIRKMKGVSAQMIYVQGKTIAVQLGKSEAVGVKIALQQRYDRARRVGWLEPPE